MFFKARGHPNISATHRTTFEITTDDYLTPRGDCIIGIGSPVAARDLPEWFKLRASKSTSLILVVLCADGGEVCDSIIGRGDERMTFSDDRKMVFRRSDYVGPETVMVRASKAAKDIDRRLVDRLKAGGELHVYMTVL